ncbi:hypothetical protein DK37_27270 [Halomonas sp. SUBG004]|nr:hypothetical protein DK37_27270 [Halomonas sp. SUBG004]
MNSRFLPGDRKAGKGKGGQRADHELGKHHAGHQREGVQVVTRKGGLGPGVREVIQRERGEQIEIHHEFAGVKGGPKGVQQWKDPNNRE